MEPLQEVKEEDPDEHESTLNNKENVPISEASTNEQDSSMIKFYDELLLTKKHNFLLEQRIQKIEKRPSEVASTLKDTEETIRAACHYMREQSVIIETIDKKLKEHEKKEKKTETDVSVQLAKFRETLEKIVTGGNNKEELKEIKEQVEKNRKMHYSDFKKIQIQVKNLSEALSNSSDQDEILDFKNHVKEVQTQLNKITELLDSPSRSHDELKSVKNQLDVIQKTNNDALKQFGKIQHEENKIVRNEITKLSEIVDKISKFYEKEIESLKEEIQANNDNLQDVQTARHDELRAMIKDQFRMFTEDFKKPMLAKTESVPVTSIVSLRECQKRPASPSFAAPPAKKEPVVNAKKVTRVEVKEIKPEGSAASQRRPSGIIRCIFCNKCGHDSVRCPRFPSASKRERILFIKKLCKRCLEPNKMPGRKHDPCPNGNVECPRCVVKFPGNKELTNHHYTICKSNEMLNRQKTLTYPGKSLNAQPYCLFCNNFTHYSLYCTRFPFCYERRCRLKQRKICTRCLEPNNTNNGQEHHPCPNADKTCPNCADGDVERHHLLLCEWIPLPRMLKAMHEQESTQCHHQ